MNTKHEMYSYWCMPFSEGARIEIENDGAEAYETPVDIRYTLLTKSDMDELLRIQENCYWDDLILDLDTERFKEVVERFWRA